eukprot:m.42398 g.42398  ORF g.42398 m.42398 type:complete len:101 (+) comp6091_c0_seq1:157-459(+)
MAGPGAAYRRGGSRSSAQTRHTVSRKSPGSLLQAMSDLFDGAYRSSREISLRGASTQVGPCCAALPALPAAAALLDGAVLGPPQLPGLPCSSCQGFLQSC